MVKTIPITKARVNLGSIIKNVRINKEYVVLEKDGYPVAGIMDIDEFEDYLEANNPRIKKEAALMQKKYPNDRNTFIPIDEIIEKAKRLEKKYVHARKR